MANPEMFQANSAENRRRNPLLQLAGYIAGALLLLVGATLAIDLGVHGAEKIAALR